MSYRLIRWATVAPGDSVRLRPKRTPGDRIETTVMLLLDRDLADGFGFINEAGVTFRQYYFDIEIGSSNAP